MMVTIICLAYNHGPYIRDALEGFVGQKTGFPFEVLVHDDASTDNTADVIREYAGRYPDIIRPVYQTENQHSKGVRIAPAFLYPLVRGRYVALCEGDDFWTDPFKLARQVAVLEANPGIDICTHRVLKTKNGRPHGFEGPRRGGIIPVQRVIMGGGGFVATSSIMCRAECYLEDTPMRQSLFIDYTLQIQGALRGGMLYLPDCMGVYRRGVPGSWTTMHSGPHKADAYPGFKKMLEILDDYTGGRYTTVIRLRRLRYAGHIFFRKLQKIFKTFRDGE